MLGFGGHFFFIYGSLFIFYLFHFQDAKRVEFLLVISLYYKWYIIFWKRFWQRVLQVYPKFDWQSASFYSSSFWSPMRPPFIFIKTFMAILLFCAQLGFCLQTFKTNLGRLTFVWEDFSVCPSVLHAVMNVLNTK